MLQLSLILWCHRESNQGHKDFQSHNYIFE
nr:MAG TPA: hypothetical protein [Caudoviricetes sp.]